MQVNRRLVVVLGCVLCAWWPGGRAWAGGYRFTWIDAGLGGLPAINASGKVAYYKSDGRGTSIDLWVWDGVLSRLAISNDSPDLTFSRPMINDHDVAVMTRAGSNRNWMWDPVGGARPVPIAPLGYEWVESLNAQGDVLIFHDWRLLRGNVYSGQASEVMRLTTDLTWPIGRGAALGEDGTIAISVRDANLTYSALRVVSGGQTTTLMEQRDGRLHLTPASINSAGTVAWGYYDERTGDRGVRIWKDGTTRLVTSFPGNALSVSINDLEQIAFHDFWLGTLNVASADGVETVLRKGDPLFGSTVSYIELGNRSINNSGQLVFDVGLADGRYAVVLATPVPEPGTAVVVGLAVACRATMRRGRRPGR